MDDFVNGIMVLVAATVILVLYFLPSIVANRNKHLNSGAILVLNIFLGWTFLGWVIALIWANTKTVAEKEIPAHQNLT